MKNPRKSSFSALTKYLTDDQDKLERVGEITITNCQSNNAEWAAVEVKATQQQNIRAQSDKTYHLLISFPEGENPTDKILKDIEKRMCEALGFDNHQRISVVHRDTDNLHIHVAINKIHPSTLTLHEPYRDHRTRDEMCKILENKYGLKKDNHKNRKSRGQGRASDMENMAGVESLISYAKNLLPQLEQASTWEQTHSILAKNGLQIRSQNNGLVIESKDGTVVKASSVARSFSKSALEKRLGGFVLNDGEFGLSSSDYRKTPIVRTEESTSLYSKYTAERHTFTLSRGAEWSKAKDHKFKAIELLKKKAALKRHVLRLASPGIAKKLASKRISNELRKDIENVNKEYSLKRSVIHQTYTRPVWQDWLKKQVRSGNEQALKILRDRKAKKPLKGNVFQPSTVVKQAGQIPGANINNITTKGNIVYRVANTPIRDDGINLKVGKWATKNGLEAALKMAVHRFGINIKVDGTTSFKEQIARVAAFKKLNITFDEPALEKLRQAFIQNPNSQEKYDGRRERRERTTNQRNASRARHNQPRARADGRGGRGYIKPNVGAVGQRPPPRSQNNLRNVSQLGVVQLSNRSEVLLQGDVSHNLEQQGAEQNNDVRRNLFRTGGINDQHLTAANKYIKERNSTKLGKTFDISEHRSYNPADAGNLQFSGIRKVDEKLLALLKKDNVVLVLPVNSQTANRLRRIKLGKLVSVTKEGKIITKGRSAKR